MWAGIQKCKQLTNKSCSNDWSNTRMNVMIDQIHEWTSEQICESLNE